MKAKTKSQLESRDTWRTPQELWDMLDAQYHFDFDACASQENAKCMAFSSQFELLPVNHSLCVWMNPPFTKASAMFMALSNWAQWVAIYRCDNMETGVWQNVILPNCDWILVFSSRVNYEGFEGESSRFPSALIGRGVPPPVGLKGTILRRSV